MTAEGGGSDVDVFALVLALVTGLAGAALFLLGEPAERLATTSVVTRIHQN